MVESRLRDSGEDLDGMMLDGSFGWCFGLDVGDDVVGCLPVDLKENKRRREFVRIKDVSTRRKKKRRRTRKLTCSIFFFKFLTPLSRQ